MGGNIPGANANDHASWPTPNYTDPIERQWLPPCAIILYAIATFSIFLRTFVRFRHSASSGFGLDDFSLLVGWLAFTSLTVFVLLGATTYKMGRHMWDIPPSGWEKVAWTNYGAIHSFLATQSAVRTSVLLFYRRLGREVIFSKLWGHACLAAIAFTVTWTVSCSFAIAFSCNTPSAYWRRFDPEYEAKFNCIDVTIVNWLAGILTVVSDLYTMALPCFLMLKLRLPPSQKVGMYVIFLVGWSVVIVSSVRAYYTHRIGSASDLSWTLYRNFLLGHLEICLGCFCASAPSLRIFYRVYMQKMPSQIKKAMKEYIPYAIHVQRRRPVSREDLSVRPKDSADPDNAYEPYSLGDMPRRPITPNGCDVNRKDSVAGAALDVFETDSTTSQSRTPKQKWQSYWQDPEPTMEPLQDLQQTRILYPIFPIREAQSSDNVDRLDNIIVTEYNRTWLTDEETGDATFMGMRPPSCPRPR